MKKNLLRAALLLLVAPFVLGACQSTQRNSSADEGKTLHFMTYNIRNGVGIDTVRNVNRIIEVIRKQQPDVLAIQELDSVTKRSNGDYTLGILADSLQMHATYAPAIDFEGGKYGVGMLSKEKPLGVKQFVLPGREEQRTFVAVEFTDFVYCCTHLSLTPEDQVLSLPIINKAVAEFNKPVIIAGDMNAHPDSEYIQGLKQTFKIVSPTDVKTYPADVPTETIDYIAIHHKDTASVKAQSSEVLNEQLASDHRPIIATLTLK